MRRRRIVPDDGNEMPAELIVFPAHRYWRSFPEYEAAFAAFTAARTAWAQQHPGAVVPQYEHHGPAPVDYSRFIPMKERKT